MPCCATSMRPVPCHDMPSMPQHAPIPCDRMQGLAVAMGVLIIVINAGLMVLFCVFSLRTVRVASMTRRRARHAGEALGTMWRRAAAAAVATAAGAAAGGGGGAPALVALGLNCRAAAVNTPVAPRAEWRQWIPRTLGAGAAVAMARAPLEAAWSGRRARARACGGGRRASSSVQPLQPHPSPEAESLLALITCTALSVCDTRMTVSSHHSAGQQQQREGSSPHVLCAGTFSGG